MNVYDVYTANGRWLRQLVSYTKADALREAVSLFGGGITVTFCYHLT